MAWITRAIIGYCWLGGDDGRLDGVVGCQILLNHHGVACDHYGEKVAIPLARKHIGWYSAGIAGSAQFRAKINITHDYEKVKEMILLMNLKVRWNKP